MKTNFRKLAGLVLGLCLALATFHSPLLYGQGTAGPAVNQNIAVGWPATGLTLTYSSGSVYPGQAAQLITGATLSLTDSKNTCTVAAIQATSDACNYVYWTSSTALNTTVTFSTATANGTILLYLCGTTGGNITGCVSAFDLPQLVPLVITLSGAITGTSAAVTGNLTSSAGQIIDQSTTNQLALGAAAHKLILSSTAPAGASQTLTLPDPTGADSVAYLALAQTLSNKVVNTVASATGAAGLNLPVGTAPTTPAIGDIWNDTTKKAIVISPTVASNPLSLGGTLCVWQPQTPITTVTTIQVLNSTSCTIPAGAINVVGKTVHVKGYYVFSNAADTPVMTVTLKLGTVLMAAPLSAANANTNSSSPVWFEFYATVASTGAAGTLEAHGTLIDTVSSATHGVAAAVYSDFLAAASSAVDLTASEAITLSLTSSSGTVTTATMRWGQVDISN
jgi:hypothetical protein